MKVFAYMHYNEDGFWEDSVYAVVQAETAAKAAEELRDYFEDEEIVENDVTEIKNTVYVF